MRRIAGLLLVGLGLGVFGYFAWSYWDYRMNAMGEATLRALLAKPDSRIAGMPFTQEVLNEHFREVFFEHLLRGLVGIVIAVIGWFLLARGARADD